MFNMKNITRSHNYKFLKDTKSIAKKTQGKGMVKEGTNKIPMTFKKNLGFKGKGSKL